MERLVLSDFGIIPAAVPLSWLKDPCSVRRDFHSLPTLSSAEDLEVGEEAGTRELADVLASQSRRHGPGHRGALSSATALGRVLNVMHCVTTQQAIVELRVMQAKNLFILAARGAILDANELQFEGVDGFNAGKDGCLIVTLAFV